MPLTFGFSRNFLGNLTSGVKVFWPHWRFSVADVLLAAVVGRAFKAKSAACNNSNHSHQQVGAGTPLRGARALHVTSRLFVADFLRA